MTPYTQADIEEDLCAALAVGDESRISALVPLVHDGPTPLPSTTMLGAALWYASIGLHVFPLQAGAKLPFPRTRGCRDATDDPARIRAWWQAHPNANVAIATGHKVDVIDFDGIGAHAAWGHEFEDEYLGAHVVGTVKTPRVAGLHVYIRATGEGNRQSMVPGVDYRGRGGYVVAPPSALDNRGEQHPGTYLFLRPLNTEAL